MLYDRLTPVFLSRTFVHSMTLNSFDRISQSFRDYLTSRAGNYDFASARDLYADIPSELYGNEPAMMSFLRGNEALGLEPREWMHVQSEFNGGLDLPENLMLGPKSLNRSIGSANMTDADISQVTELNADAVEVLLEADPQVLLDALPEVAEATTVGLTVVAETAGASELAATAAEASEAGIGELIGEAVVEGVVPAIFAAKAATFVADKCDTPEDKLGYGSLAAGGTVLLYANPVTGPIAWTATGIYSAYKLVRLGCKVAPHIKRQVELHQARNRGMWA